MQQVTTHDALAAIADALAGAAPVAVVTLVGGAGTPGARLLVRAHREDAHDAHDEVAGSLGEAELDARALALATAALMRGGVSLETVAWSGGETTLFVEAHRAPERLVVVGAGHIAVPLAALGVELGFDVIVLDDREEFATAERFHPSARVRRARFDDDPFADVAIDDRTYVALVTRGHRWDFDCLRRLLARPARPRYIGMIGSRRRVRAALSALVEAGVARSELAAVHAPIGLDVGAETPAEIAVSIAAELIAVRRGVAAPTLAERERVVDRLLRETAQDDG